jgi:GT2 family glycosyltransferase
MLPRGPVSVPAPVVATRRVWCVVPWHAGAGEAEAVLRDVGGQVLALAGAAPMRVDVQVLLIDNASAERVALPAAVSREGGVRFTHVRLGENRGGSGGFNAGIERALREAADLEAPADEHAYIWLLDSDARASADALVELVRVLESRSDLCAVGSALADPETGRVFEVGGMIDRRTGALRAACAGEAGAPGVVLCDYAASCSVLVRVSAARAAGPMPDLFLHADDAAWMVRMARVTGRKVGAARASVVYHPRFDRVALRGRYYVARNATAPLRELGLGRWPALRRSLREVGRGVQQELCGRRDLARLHVLGLRDARGPAPVGAGSGLSEKLEPFAPLEGLGDALRPLVDRTACRRVRVAACAELGLSEREHERLCEGLASAGLRDVGGAPGRAWEVRPAARPGAGLLGAPGLVMVTPGVRGGGRHAGFVVRTGTPAGVLSGAAATGLGALRHALGLARGWRPGSLPVARPSRDPERGSASARALPTLSVVVVSYNRWSALRSTLTRLESMAEFRGCEVVVVDNASSDGSAGYVEREFPRARLLRLGTNSGVAAFNRGVRAATGDVVLVLDDDAWPEPGVVERALRLLADRPGVGGVALHPRHPTTGRSEWRQAHLAAPGASDWPFMGCGNLVRRAAWLETGGYEERFFLYRNDVDLAMKLLGAGWGVWFDPAWTVWHDSPAAARKSVRWHRLATRNWVWLARRHGRGLGCGGVLGGMVGWAWAHRLAGRSLSRHSATLAGVLEGLTTAPPRVDRVSMSAFGRLVRLGMGRADRSARGQRGVG